MIKIINKKDCVGCNGCVQCCPKNCISFKEDEQGFQYPEVKLTECINCGLCEKVCPVINQGHEQKPLAVYAAHCLDKKILNESSSGGIFSVLANRILEQGGVVFGARFDENWMVIHDSVVSVEDLDVLRGSKYVQSQIGTCYRQVEKHLKTDKLVMFTGTPCQVAGLNLFLRKKYENLFLVEVICHGVPSPKVWKEYLKSFIKLPTKINDNSEFSNSVNKHEHITHISFRDKRRGWEKYGFSLIKADLTESYRSLQENEYMQIFLRDLDLRPSCYACPSKCGKSNCDLTLGDFWGVSHLEPKAYCQDGTSLILVNTTKGEKLLSEINISLIKTNYSKAILSNASLVHSAAIPPYYNYFWERYHAEGIASLPIILKKVRGSLLRRLNKYARCRLKFLFR